MNNDIQAEVRNAALEEAAKVAGSYRMIGAGTIAAAIRSLATSPAPSAKQEPKLVPKWAGEFRSHADWVNRAQRVLSVPSHKPPAVCVDTKGRRCFIGADMARARDEGAFPVRYFWECELAAPSASQGEVKVPEGLTHVGTLSVFEDKEATFGHAYDISTNAAGHKALQAMDGYALYAAPSVTDWEGK